MFSLSMGKGCLFWYIGRSDDVRARLPKKSDGSFLWILDEELQNSFHLRSGDDLLDLKLMHLARLFDKSIDAAMFGEIDL